MRQRVALGKMRRDGLPAGALAAAHRRGGPARRPLSSADPRKGRAFPQDLEARTVEQDDDLAGLEALRPSLRSVPRTLQSCASPPLAWTGLPGRSLSSFGAQPARFDSSMRELLRRRRSSSSSEEQRGDHVSQPHVYNGSSLRRRKRCDQSLRRTTLGSFLLLEEPGNDRSQ